MEWNGNKLFLPNKSGSALEFVLLVTARAFIVERPKAKGEKARQEERKNIKSSAVMIVPAEAMNHYCQYNTIDRVLR